MGKGLMTKRTGTHVAFAGGTGVLVFVDLVMHIALSHMEEAHTIIPDKNNILDPVDFKFKLYVSFPSRADSVALELFEALDNYCKHNNYTNFELHVRLSKEKVNPARWNEKFVLEEMAKFDPKEVNRVWVCGPPVMDETFERAFASDEFGALGY